MLPFIILVWLCILGFALYGFIEAIRRLRGGNKTPARQTALEQEVSAEAAATCRMLDRLYRLEAISFEEYSRLRDAMEGRFPQVVLPQRLSRYPQLGLGPDQATSPQATPPQATEEDRPHVFSAIAVDEVGPALVSPEQEPPPLTASLSTTPIHAEATPRSGQPPTQSPFDVPDVPPKPPARPWSDLLAGFMQEKNIRWGELASGILIVGSAVGLVVSLREQLRETIPYFPALLFMLITGAIHGSGAYTLKRWKLRNTSRGVLIIGLLLVPLNFLAACILTGSGEQQRALTDPVYWIAIVVGIAGFSVMTWFSSKYLLRRGNLPLFIAIMGCSVTLLLINRVDNPLHQSWLTMMLCLPIAISFSIGVCTVDRRQWLRTRWSDRAVNRLLLLLGISAFALVVAVSLLVVRADDRWQTSLALAPTLAVLAGISAWLGAIIQQGAQGKEAGSLRIVGTSLLILGLIMVAGLIAITVVNPTLQVIVCLVSGLLLAGMSWHRLVYAWPAVWACLAVGVLVGFNLLVGNFQFDRWTSFPELREALVSGSSGLCLLATGALVATLQFGLRQRSTMKTPELQWRLGLISGGAIAAVGCGLALVASFVDRTDPFDMHVATALLGVASCVTGALVAAKPRQGFAWVAVLTALVFLAHALLWNQFLAEHAVRVTMGIDARWQSVAALLGLACAVYAALIRWRYPNAIYSGPERGERDGASRRFLPRDRRLNAPVASAMPLTEDASERAMDTQDAELTTGRQATIEGGERDGAVARVLAKGSSPQRTGG